MDTQFMTSSILTFPDAYSDKLYIHIPASMDTYFENLLYPLFNLDGYLLSQGSIFRFPWTHTLTPFYMHIPVSMDTYSNKLYSHIPVLMDTYTDMFLCPHPCFHGYLLSQDSASAHHIQLPWLLKLTKLYSHTPHPRPVLLSQGSASTLHILFPMCTYSYNLLYPHPTSYFRWILNLSFHGYLLSQGTVSPPHILC